MERAEVAVPEKFLDGHQGGGLGMLQRPADFTRGRERTERCHDTADLGRCQRGHQPLGAVWQQDGDTVATSDTHCEKGPGELVDLGTQRRVGEAGVSEDNRLRLRPRDSHLVEEGAQRLAGR